MKKVKRLSQGYILLSTLCLLSVVILAFLNPQSVMDLVQVKLPNTDAYSSIRGIYGGAGLAISISLVYLMVKNVKGGLAFLTMMWGFYALSRLITIFNEGALGAFGKQWIIIETVFCLAAVLLLVLMGKEESKRVV